MEADQRKQSRSANIGWPIIYGQPIPKQNRLRTCTKPVEIRGSSDLN